MLPLRQNDVPSYSLAAVVNDEIEIVPFLNASDCQNIPDTHLAQVYRRIVREKSVYKIFYDGSIQKTSDFIIFFKGKKHDVFL